MKITTNNHPRYVVDATELTATERAKFDYIDWDAIDEGEAWASFVRYQGEMYDLGEFDNTRNLHGDSPLHEWDGYLSDSFFSGLVIRFADEYCDSIVVGRYMT